jgi:hypothetical protein
VAAIPLRSGVPRPRPSSLPISLIFGLVIGLYGSITYAAGSSGEVGVIARWHLFDMGCAVAQYLLLAHGLFGLAARLPGRSRIATRVAAWSSLVVLAWVIARPIFMASLDMGDTLWTVDRWAFRVGGLATLTITVALAVAGRGRSPMFAVGAIVASLVSGWLPYLGDKLFEIVAEHPLMLRVYFPIRELVWALCVLGMVVKLWRDAPALRGDLEPVADARTVTTGLRRMVTGLGFQLVAALVIGGTSLVATATELPGSMALVGPCLLIVALLGFAWGSLDLERGQAAGVPRITLALGALLAAWWAGVHLQQVASVHAIVANVDSYARDDNWVSTWSILGPLIGATGLLLVGSAVSHARDSDGVTVTATGQTTVFAILTVIHVCLETLITEWGDRGVMIDLLALATSVGALFALTSLVRDVTSHLARTAAIPEARVARVARATDRA